MTTTIRLETLLEAAVQSGQGNFWTSLPGRVEAFDQDTCLADVQPMVRRSYKDESGERVSESLPQIPWCPVYFQGGSAGRLTFPVKKGDLGILVFTSCSLDNLLATGNEVDPKDDRRNTLTDAYFLHGGHSMIAPPSDYSDDDVVLSAENLLKLGGIGADESALWGTSFINALNTLLTALDTFANANIGGGAMTAAINAFKSGDYLSGKVVLV